MSQVCTHRAETVTEQRAGNTSASERTSVFGVDFDNVTIDEAIERIDALVQSRRSAMVVTPNVNHLVRAKRTPWYADLVARADLVLADGFPIVLASGLLGRPLKERVAGSDLLPRLCSHAGRAGYRVFFLGGDPPRDGRAGAAEAARARLIALHPALNIVGVYCPPHGFERDAAEVQRAVSAIRQAEPQIVFVGLGSPKQEQFIAAHAAQYGPAVSVGVGVTFSFVAGHVKRAPQWMRRRGLEWVHRIFQEPGRLWKRYLLDGIHFAPLLAGSLISRMTGNQPIGGANRSNRDPEALEEAF